MASKRLGRIAIENSAFFMCDMQESFRKTIKYFPQITEVCRRMLAGAKVLDMPIIVTEQYPKGLGHTVPELDVSSCPVFPKTKFSMVLPDVQKYLADSGKDVKSVILCGIESHVCIQQTVLDMLEKDFEVHVLADGVSSRSMVDRMYALQRMREAGAFLTTSESILLGLCKDAKHPSFKEIQKLIWDEAPDSGLLSHKITGDPSP